MRFLIIALALLISHAAHAQSGQLRAGSFLGNPSASARSATDATASQMFDRNFGSTNGYTVKRQNGTWQGVPGLVINVMEAPYSATCNGSANDTTAFNAALVAANAAGGGIVTAPDGKVCIIQSGTSIAMQNNTCIKGNFTLRGTSATNNTEMIFASDKTNICIEDVTIDMIDSFVSGNNNNAAMSFAGTSLTALTVSVKNVKVINQGNFGVLVNGGSCRILNNQFTMNSPYGVVTGVGQQNHAIQTAASFVSECIIDGNVAKGSSINVTSQKAIVTNNRVSTWSYGSGIGHGGLGLPCTIKHTVGATSCGAIIAFNEIEGGIGIDANTFVVACIESYDPQNIIVGNHCRNVAGTGIIGPGGSIGNNIIADVCNYYATATISGGCQGIILRNDGAAGDVGTNTVLSGNKIIASFGAPMAVTGTTNSGGVIRITVSSTATVGATNTSVPCRVTGVGGTTNANFGWAACVVKSLTSIELTGSVFNSAWTSGGTIGPMMDYAYSENSAAMPGIKLAANNFMSGLTGTYDILNTGTTASAPDCAAPCTPSNGALMVGLGGANNVWVPRAITGDLGINSSGVATLPTVNANVGSWGGSTTVGSFTVNAKGLITAASSVTITPAITNVTGLGTNVALFLGTPSSANFASALTTKTGSGLVVFDTSPTLTTAVAAGTWTASGTWTLPAHTLGGTVSGGGNNINNVNIGASSPGTGTFTTVTAGPSTDSVSGSVAAAALARVASFLSPSMSNDNKVYLSIGTANSSNNAFYQYYNHHSTTASRYWAVQAFEASAGAGLSVFADGGASIGAAASAGPGTLKLKAQVFSAVTACSGTTEGAIASITDSSTATWGATVTGSSTNHVLAYCNGTNWTVAGK